MGGSAPGLLPFDFDRDGDQDLLVVDPFTPAVLLVNRHRDLRPGQPVVGQAWQPVVWSQPGYATAPHFAGLGIATVRLPQPVTWAPYGELALDLATTIVLSGLAPVPGNAAVFPLVVPNVPVLQGLPVHVQGIVYAPPQPPRFTAWFSIAVQ